MRYLGGAMIIVICGSFLLSCLLITGLLMQQPFFSTLYLIMDNRSIIGVLLAALSLIYMASLLIEKVLAKKSQDRFYHSRVIQIALEHGNQITAPMLALDTSLKLSECERILKEFEKKQVVSSSTPVGEAVVYHLAPLIYENWLPSDGEYCGKADETEGDEKEQKIWKKWLKVTGFILVTIIAPLWLLDKQTILSEEFMTGALFVNVFAVIRIFHVVYLTYRNYVRKTEHDVLGYVMDNQGVLYPQEIAEFTDESLSSIQRMADRWHKANLVSMSYGNDGTVMYLFPNVTAESMVYLREPNYNPLAQLKRVKEQLMQTCCYVFLYSFLAGYAFMNWSHFIFYGGIGAVCAAYRTFYSIQAREEAEQIERIGLQVATHRNGQLTVHELAYNAMVSMKEAAKLLKKWELANIARRIEIGEGFVPVYIISGVVSKEQRLASERV